MAGGIGREEEALVLDYPSGSDGNYDCLRTIDSAGK